MEKKVTGLEKTLNILATSKNDAAIDALLAGLDSQYRPASLGSLRVLIERRPDSVAVELVNRWPTLPTRAKQLLVERSDWLVPALRDGLKSNDVPRFTAACNAAVSLKAVETISLIALAIEERFDQRRSAAIRAIQAMADVVYDDLINPRDYRSRRDPQAIRTLLASELESVAAKYATHESNEPIEAWLTLIPREDPMLKRVLHSPKDPTFQPILDVFATSSRPGVLRLLLGFLEEPQMPHAILDILTNRQDILFLRHLLKRMENDVSPQVRVNFQRMVSFAWQSQLATRIIAFNEQEQEALVELLCVSGIDRKKLYDLLQQIIRRAEPLGRAAAVAKLTMFEDSAADQELLLALNDPEPVVQAAAFRAMKGRSIVAAADAILNAVESEHLVVRSAVRETLSEFNFPKYRLLFDHLNEEVRLRLGPLIKILDPNSIDLLRVEINNELHSRRLRALEMTEAMEAGNELRPELIKILEGNDHVLAQLAAKALVDSPTEETRAALTAALESSSITVREAAEETLEIISKSLKVVAAT